MRRTAQHTIAEPTAAKPTAAKHWILPLVVALVCMAIALSGDTGREALRYLGPEHGGPSHRWLTAHLTHLGWGHLVLNLAGLVGVWAIYGRVVARGVWVGVLLACPLAISLGLSRLSPEVVSYVGASGMLHGLLAFGALASMGASLGGDRRQVLAELVVLAGVWGKVAFEQWAGPVPMTAELSGGGVVVDAHFYGAAAGTGLGLAVIFTRCSPRFLRLR